MNKNYDKRNEEINYKVNMAVEEPDIENRYDECIKDLVRFRGFYECM